MADHMLVMERGVVVEQGTPQKIFTAHQHPYTKKLLDAIPNSSKPPSHTQRHPEPLVQVNHLRTSFRLDRRTQVHAVNDISQIGRASCRERRYISELCSVLEHDAV